MKDVDVFGRLDIVVNNAGYGEVAPFEQLSSERFKALIDTNFYGVVYVTRAALPIMRKQKSGCILQISSLGGRMGLPGRSDAVPYAREAEAARADEANRWREMSVSTDVDAPGALPALQF